MHADLLYTWLFQASAATLRTVAADPRHLGAEIGVLSILHTEHSSARGHAYGVGASAILDLREEAKRALGPKFDLREFHSQVLEDGLVTLPVLRAKINQWIRNTR